MSEQQPQPHGECQQVRPESHGAKSLVISVENIFPVALIATLGALTGLVIGGMVSDSILVITYVGAALFIALGLEPVVRLLQQARFPRALAVLTVFIVLLAIVVGAGFLVVPAVTSQAQEVAQQIPVLATHLREQEWFQWVNTQLDGNISEWVAKATEFLNNPQNVITLAGGVVSVGANLASGFTSALIILVLTLYFMSSLDTLKRTLVRLLPNSKRRRASELGTKVFDTVGKYVISQSIIAATHAVCVYIAMTIFGIQFREVLAIVAFLLAMLPLIGSISAAAVIVLMTLITQVIADPVNLNLWPALFIGIYYLVYMQVEAYVLTPRIVNRAVPIPGVVVVIAALTGGTLLGVFGALLAIPVAASVIMLVREVWIPRQDKK